MKHIRFNNKKIMSVAKEKVSIGGLKNLDSVIKIFLITYKKIKIKIKRRDKFLLYKLKLVFD